jgi:hypothetical protein
MTAAGRTRRVEVPSFAAVDAAADHGNTWTAIPGYMFKV